MLQRIELPLCLTAHVHIYAFVIQRLYRERSLEVQDKLEEVRAGRAPEYLGPLSQLQQNMQIRTQVAGLFNTKFVSPYQVTSMNENESYNCYGKQNLI